MRQNTRQGQNQQSSELAGKSQAYLQIHAHAFFSSLGRLVRNAFTSVMTILVMSIAITLAIGFYLLVLNLQQLTGNLESSNQISLFLKSSVSERAGQHLVEQLVADQRIDRALYISKQQALEEFKNYSGFGEVLDVLEDNPLPSVIQVLPKNTLVDYKSVEKLLQEYSRMHQVDFAQLDMQWVKRLQSIMQVLQRGVFIISLLLGIAVLFITGNTIRLELQNRKDEVLVAKLVGATHAFIQRPFLYTGFWLGFFSGVVAWLLATVMIMILQSPIENLSLLYDSSFDIKYLGFTDTVSMLIITSLLGISGAWGVLMQQLKQIKPE